MKEFKKPDLKAPRFRVNKPGILGPKFYIAFKKKFPQYAKIPNNELKSIIYEYNGNLWKGVIEHRDGIELPQGLGNMFIGTCSSPKIRYNSDFRSSIKNDTLTRLKNYESAGFLAKIFYTNYASKYLFAFREFWEFKGTRDFTRTVSSTYPINWKKYIVVENTLLISKLYKKAKNKVYGKDLPQTLPLNYNEFNLD
jgi:hypothetical protein